MEAGRKTRRNKVRNVVYIERKRRNRSGEIKRER